MCRLPAEGESPHFCGCICESLEGWRPRAGWAGRPWGTPCTSPAEDPDRWSVIVRSRHTGIHTAPRSNGSPSGTIILPISSAMPRWVDEAAPAGTDPGWWHLLLYVSHIPRTPPSALLCGPHGDTNAVVGLNALSMLTPTAQQTGQPGPGLGYPPAMGCAAREPQGKSCASEPLGRLWLLCSGVSQAGRALPSLCVLPSAW